jgi:plastocyanin
MTMGTMGTMGSSASSSGSTGGTTGTSSSSGSTGGSTGGTYLITIQNFAFTPANLDVPAGATITVANMDGFPHTVTSNAIGDTTSYNHNNTTGPTFDVSLGSGVTKTFTVTGGAAGDIVPYFCNVHQGGMNPTHPTITLH